MTTTDRAVNMNILSLSGSSTSNAHCFPCLSVNSIVDFSLVICGVQSVFVGQGCCNKILQAGWLEQQKGIFAQLSRIKMSVKLVFLSFS